MDAIHKQPLNFVMLRVKIHNKMVSALFSSLFFLSSSVKQDWRARWYFWFYGFPAWKCQLLLPGLGVHFIPILPSIGIGEPKPAKLLIKNVQTWGNWPEHKLAISVMLLTAERDTATFEATFKTNLPNTWLVWLWQAMIPITYWFNWKIIVVEVGNKEGPA